MAWNLGDQFGLLALGLVGWSADHLADSLADHLADSLADY